MIDLNVRALLQITQTMAGMLESRRGWRVESRSVDCVRSSRAACWHLLRVEGFVLFVSARRLWREAAGTGVT